MSHRSIQLNECSCAQAQNQGAMHVSVRRAMQVGHADSFEDKQHGLQSCAPTLPFVTCVLFWAPEVAREETADVNINISINV